MDDIYNEYINISPHEELSLNITTKRSLNRGKYIQIMVKIEKDLNDIQSNMEDELKKSDIDVFMLNNLKNKETMYDLIIKKINKYEELRKSRSTERESHLQTERIKQAETRRAHEERIQYLRQMERIRRVHEERMQYARQIERIREVHGLIGIDNSDSDNSNSDNSVITEHSKSININDMNNFIHIKRSVELYECSVCITKINTNIIKTKCDHYFCNNCLTKWMHSNNNCPNCRYIFI
jgi:hypothetical protein